MHPLIKDLVTKGITTTDGSWGTQMQARGLTRGESPDSWNLSHPDLVEEVARSYVDAGSQIILTNTFGANRFVLERFDMAHETDAINRATVSLYNKILGVEQIDSVLVKGNKRVESEAILAAIESKQGDSLDQNQLDQDLRAVFKLGYFTDVKIETEIGPKGKVVIFDVTEKQSIAKITFKGNKKVKEKDLSKETGIKLYTVTCHAITEVFKHPKIISIRTNHYLLAL